jgi:hypothetical protein
MRQSFVFVGGLLDLFTNFGCNSRSSYLICIAGTLSPVYVDLIPSSYLVQGNLSVMLSIGCPLSEIPIRSL